MSFPWTLVLALFAGVAIVFTPALLEIGGTVANVSHIAGALIVTMSALAMGEILRPVRFLNVLLGLAVAAAPWLFAGGETLNGAIASTLLGIAAVALSLPRGEIHERYGLWQRFVR